MGKVYFCINIIETQAYLFFFFKTSFIEFLLGRSYPGQTIGPEPTTDKFVAVFHGEEDNIIPGYKLFKITFNLFLNIYIFIYIY